MGLKQVHPKQRLIFCTLQIAAVVKLESWRPRPKPKSEVAEGVDLDSIFFAQFVREDTGMDLEIVTFIF